MNNDCLRSSILEISRTGEDEKSIGSIAKEQLHTPRYPSHYCPSTLEI